MLSQFGLMKRGCRNNVFDGVDVVLCSETLREAVLDHLGCISVRGMTMGSKMQKRIFSAVGRGDMSTIGRTLQQGDVFWNNSWALCMIGCCLYGIVPAWCIRSIALVLCDRSVL